MPSQTPVNVSVPSGQAAYIGTAAPPPGAPSFALTGPATAVAGVSQNYTLTGSNLVVGQSYVGSLVSGDPSMVDTPSEVTLTSVSPAAVVGVLFAAVGAQTLKGVMASGAESNQLTVTVSPAPPPPPPVATSLALSITPSSGTTGSTTATVTVTPNGPIPAGGGSASLGLTGGGTLGASSLNFSAGSSSPQTTTISRSSDGTSTVALTNSMGLSNLGTPATFATSPAPPPPPPAPPSGTPQPFTLTSAAGGTAIPVFLGYPVRHGDVPAGSGIVLTGTGANLRATIKSTFADGSASFAVISGTVDLTAGVPKVITVAAGTPAGGAALAPSNLPSGIRTTGIQIAASGIGSANWSGTDFDSPFLAWYATPESACWIYRKPVGSDPHLVAWLSVTLFAGGKVRVLPWVENGYLLVASPTNKAATFTFTLGGSERESLTFDLLNHQRAPLISGTKLDHWLDTPPDLVVAHDKAYLQATKLVPTYRATVDPSSAAVTSRPSTFAPLQQGDYPGGMGAAGYHGSIGMLPEWDVIYLTTTAASMHAVVQRNAYSAGRYGIHFRDESTNRPLRFSQHPNLVVGGGNGISGTGASSTSTYTPNASGGTPPTYASTHHPSMGELAYMLTGDFYHLETMQFVATANYLKNGDLNRTGAGNGSDGIFRSTAGANTTRGVGWAIRSLAQAAALTPDADPLAAEFRASLGANAAWHHARYVAQPSNPQGWIEPYSDYSAPVVATTEAGSTSTNIVFPVGYVFLSDDYYNAGWELVIGGETRDIVDYVGATRTAIVSPAFTVPTASQPFELRTDNLLVEATWMQDFVTAAFGYALSMQPPLGSTNLQKLEDFFHWKAQSIVGRFGSPGRTEFLYRDAAQYSIPVAPDNFPDWNTGTGPWFGSWGELYDALAAGAVTNGTPLGAREAGDLRGTSGANPGDPTGYWGNLMPALSYAVEHGVAGAYAAYLGLTQAGNWATLAAAFNSAPVWGVKPPEEPTMPAWLPAIDTFNYIGVVTGTTGAGSTITSIVLPVGVSTEDGWYVGHEIIIAGNVRRVTAYNGATRTATVVAFSGGGGPINVVSQPFEMRSTLRAVSPAGWPTNDVGGPIINWCGAVFNPDYCKLGAWDNFGSGHLALATDPLWAGVNHYNFDKLRFEMTNVPVEPTSDSTGFNTYGESTDPDTAGHLTTPHSYDALGFRPRSAGGGRKGALRHYCFPGTPFNRVGHEFDLSSLTAPPTRTVTDLPTTGSSNNYIMCAPDVGRRGDWLLPYDGVSPMLFVSWDTGAVTSHAVGYSAYGNHSMVLLPAPWNWLLAGGRANEANNATRWFVCPIVGGVPTGFTEIFPTGTPPSDGRTGLVFDAQRDQIVMKVGGPSDYGVVLLTPPAPGGSHTTGWAFSAKTLTGVGGIAPAWEINTNSGSPYDNNGTWSKFQPVRITPLINAYAWVGTINKPMQAWRF